MCSLGRYRQGREAGIESSPSIVENHIILDQVAAPPLQSLDPDPITFHNPRLIVAGSMNILYQPRKSLSSSIQMLVDRPISLASL
jgi:hypothetical protein